MTPIKFRKNSSTKKKKSSPRKLRPAASQPTSLKKWVVGRLKKFLDEVSLTGQPFVKDPDMNVGTLLAKHKAKVLAFHRYEVGEGIEKVIQDFKEAVMSQAQGS